MVVPVQYCSIASGQTLLRSEILGVNPLCPFWINLCSLIFNAINKQKGFLRVVVTHKFLLAVFIPMQYSQQIMYVWWSFHGWYISIIFYVKVNGKTEQLEE